MESKRVDFSVKMKTRYMFGFLYVNSYSGLRGIINYCISGLAVLVMIYGFFTQGREYAYPYDLASWIVVTVIALAFTVIDPGILYFKAFQQVKTNAVFKEAIEYSFSEDGFTIKQGEQNSDATWEYVLLAKETARLFILYTGNNNAVILPKEAMTWMTDAFREILVEVLPNERLQLLKSRKED